jgi:hypothetical protein
MEPAMWSPRWQPSREITLKDYLTFLGRQLLSPWFWLLYLVLFASAILITYRKYLRNRIFWSI